MIPAYNDEGYLPPGIHPANVEEIAARFGTGSELREVQMESLHWLVELGRALELAGSLSMEALSPTKPNQMMSTVSC